MRLGIVTCAKCRDLTANERPLLDHLAAAGANAEPLVWNDPSVNWGAFEGLLVRSIWDYHLHHDDFIAWLQRMDQLKIPVWNPVPVLRWNSHKFYLRDLADAGVTIAPTLFHRRGDTTGILRAKEMGWADVVIKPAVSASGYRTHQFSLASPEAVGRIHDAAAHGDYLVQPFLHGIRDAGELSLIYLHGHFSHAILKKPADGEFRVQAEYGGQAVPVSPSPDIIRAGEDILEKTGMPWLYARVDGLVDKDRFILMELELIEPDLFLEMKPGAHLDFVNGFLAKLRPSASS